MASRRVTGSVSEMTLKISWRLTEECFQYVRAYMTTGICAHAHTHMLKGRARGHECCVCLFLGLLGFGACSDMCSSIGSLKSKQHFRLLSSLRVQYFPKW